MGRRPARGLVVPRLQPAPEERQGNMWGSVGGRHLPVWAPPRVGEAVFTRTLLHTNRKGYHGGRGLGGGHGGGSSGSDGEGESGAEQVRLQLKSSQDLPLKWHASQILKTERH